MEREIAAAEECDGQFLQRVRLYKGVTLEHMSEEIRVVKSTLAALEANEFSALPVAVFTRGFVVQMARVLGLDENKTAAAYMKFFRAKQVAR
jgi:cytoskeletal protein RodZ